MDKRKLVITIERQYGSGGRFVGKRLAKELGISRTPFRDAIHRLAQEGYIDIIPSKGFRLHQITERDVIETFQIRTALETYCTMQIARDVKDVPSVVTEWESPFYWIH